MKLIVGCETSQKITIAFRRKGHEAYSCDILPCDGEHPEWHIQDDIFSVLNTTRFDMGIFHPPCTFLTNAGSRWLYEKHDRWQKMVDGALFFKRLLEWDIPKSVLENPIMHKHAVKIIGRRQDQVIQPWMFGHMEKKATCLWLNGVPELRFTHNVKAETDRLPKKEQQKIFYSSPSVDRWKIRSVTYDGIASAMANQWNTDRVIPKYTYKSLFDV